MKKLLIVAVVALLALALVACGSETPTTTKGISDATTPAVTDVKTTPAETDPKTPGVETTTPETTKTPGTETTTPETTSNAPFPGVDILNGLEADMAINATWGGELRAGAFENHHSALDFHWAYVLLFQECENSVYEDLIMTDLDEEGNEIWLMNEDYKWVLTLNGEDIEIERFSIYHQVTYGYVRLDLGEDFVLAPEDEDGQITYDIVLRIFDVTNNDAPVYYAWLTDPAWNGKHSFTPPAPIEMVADENRDPAETMIPGATPFSGPTGYTGELYENLFDLTDTGAVKVQTKLCTEDVSTPIIWKYDDVVYVTSYSLVGANDDVSYYDRVVTSFKLYGSTNGTEWTLLDEQNGAALESGEGLSNYAERNFKLTKAAEYTYFKLEPVDATKYQLSGIVLWTKE